MAVRIARGYEAVHHPYQEKYEGTRPSIQGLRAYKGLPVAFVDKQHEDDPVVILPGTFVGLLNTGAAAISTGDTWNNAEESARALVPAHQVAYTLSYSAYDTDFGTPHIDFTGTDTVTAREGDSTSTIGPVKPIGVVTAPIYSSALADKYSNYTRDLPPSILCGNYCVVIPAMTVNERAIEPGDRVMIDNTASAQYDPRAVGSVAAHAAGRIMKADQGLAGTDTGSARDFIVGRCINKWIVATDSTAASEDQLSATYTAGRTLDSVNTNYGYDTLNRVQTAPGLGLSGSGTQGVPAMFKHARADSAGNFYALEIRIDL